MLSKQSLDTLAGLSGVDTAKLEEAIKSEQEVSLEIDGERKAYSPDELKQKIDNAIEKEKPNMKTSWEEELSRKRAKDLGLELSHEEAKDPKKVDKALQEKVLSDAKLEQSSWQKKYNEEISKKDEIINQYKTTAEASAQQLQKMQKDIQINSIIEKELDDEIVLSKTDRISLFKNKYETDQHPSGKLGVKDKITGEFLVDDIGNPLPLQNVVKDFDNEYAHIKKASSGRGTGTPPGGGAKKSSEEIYKQVQEEGVKPGTQEYYDRAYELKKENEK